MCALVTGVQTCALPISSIELGDGETFVISGLVSTSLNDSVNKLPWLGDIPVLGAFFKSTTLDRSDKELIMVVTPHLVRPVVKGVALPDRTRVVWGKRVSVRVDFGGRRLHNKKKK